jgi:hypothetical protein
MRAMPVTVFAKLMGCQDDTEAMAIADALAVEPYYPRGIPGFDPNVALGFLVNTSADFDGMALLVTRERVRETHCFLL